MVDVVKAKRKDMQEDKRLLLENEQLLDKFISDLRSEGKSEARCKKYNCILRIILGWIKKNVNYVVEDDLRKLVMNKIENNPNFKDWTKSDYKLSIKVFFKRLRQKGYPKDYPVKELRGKKLDDDEKPKETRFIKTGVDEEKNKLLPQDILTEEEILKLISAIANIKYRVLTAILYDSGCRIGEVMELKIKDTHEDDFGYIIDVNGKTGKREIQLTFSSEYLRTWLSSHPSKKPNDYLWVRATTEKNELKRFSYEIYCRVLKDTARRLGIKKRVTPHAFRHARATFWADKLTEQELKLQFGWKSSSDMPSTYVHLSSKNLKNKILEKSGNKKYKEAMKNGELKSKNALITMECICGRENPVSEKSCLVCGRILVNRNINIMEEIRKKEFARLETEISQLKQTVLPLIERITQQDPQFNSSLKEKIQINNGSVFLPEFIDEQLRQQIAQGKIEYKPDELWVVPVKQSPINRIKKKVK